jgi:hypothetical protein
MFRVAVSGRGDRETSFLTVVGGQAEDAANR